MIAQIQQINIITNRDTENHTFWYEFYIPNILIRVRNKKHVEYFDINVTERVSSEKCVTTRECKFFYNKRSNSIVDSSVPVRVHK